MEALAPFPLTRKDYCGARSQETLTIFEGLVAQWIEEDAKPVYSSTTPLGFVREALRDFIAWSDLPKTNSDHFEVAIAIKAGCRPAVAYINHEPVWILVLNKEALQRSR